MFRKIWEGWKKGAEAVGKAQTFVFMSIIFVLVIPFFSFIRFKDPLRKRLNPVTSFWEGRKPSEHTLERLRRPF